MSDPSSKDSPSPSEEATVPPTARPEAATLPPTNPFRSASPRDLPPQFGRYRIDRKLGEGGMGAVYLAFDAPLSRPVALKVPFLDGPDADVARARFLQEARSASPTRSPWRCSTLTRRASSTATSSPATSCSTAAASRSSWTSAWPAGRTPPA